MSIGLPAVMLGAGAFSATTQYMAGQQQAKAMERQASYNAEIYEQQASMIEQKKKLTDYQMRRQGARNRGAIVAATAGKGLLLSGSPLAILADSEAQFQLDRSIESYNADVEAYQARSGAAMTRYQGKIGARNARTQGFTNAFSTALGTGASYYSMYNYPSNSLQSKRTIDRPTAALGGRTYKSPYGNTYRY